MTPEEKTRAYDEAIKKAAALYKASEPMSGCNVIIETLFPELAESKDEKIRKWIIDDIRYNIDNEPLNNSEYKKQGERAIAWLEKQGKQKPILDFKARDWYVNKIDSKIHNIYHSVDKVEPKFKVGDVLCDKSCTTLSKEAQSNFEITDIRNGMYICDKCSFPISQQDEYELVAKRIEQKPTDKVEPKFHEGEWITNGDYTWKIVEVKPLDYILQSQDGNIVDDTISHVDEQFHSFTIQDAKDGDVLTDVCGNIGIYNKHNAFDWTSYCSLGRYFQCFKAKYENEKTYPATKEQRALLFQKMKEAGYEWDSEKKELNKFHVIDEGKAEMDYCFTKMMNNEKVSSAWSEEDTFKVQRICKYLDEAKKYYADIAEVRECMDWLKSLRSQNNITDEELAQAKKNAYNDALDKIEYHSGEPTFDDGWSAAIWYLKKRNIQPQPKQKWDEKDEMILSLIINNLKYIRDTISRDDKYVIDVDSFEGQIEWLKSLRPKNS